MPNPSLSANALLEDIGWLEPSDMNMEEIAWSCGLVVKFKEMDGSQGRIIMSKEEGIIAINNSINYQPKINYIIAHEIGHFRLHRDLSLFADDDNTLSEWYTQGAHEKEANTFAAGLLMPSDLFERRVKNKKLELSLIEEVANYFGASKTATFLRYKELGPYPVMVIFIENGIVKWKSHSEDFPYRWLLKGTKLPPFTVAGDYYYNRIEEKRPVKVDAMEWFPDDYGCQKDVNPKLWEQCFPSTEKSLVTCLWTA